MSDIFAKPLVFVDIETTGGSHFSSRVLEVAAVRVEQGRVVRSYQTLLYPEEPVPSFISGLTGITDDDVLGQPRFADIADELADILEGAVFVAHNVRFDYGFLRMEFGRLGADFAPPLLCTVKLSRRLFPQYRTHKLADLIARHNLVAPARHRAFDDAMCLWQFYRMCLAEFDLDTIEQALRAQLAIPSLPSQLDKAQLDQLPEGPGVYLFEDEAGHVLYVGKSVTVKRRVLSHFAADGHDAKELKLAQLVRRLRAIPTAGELGALLLESDLVKELQPLYNRQLRRTERVTLLVMAFNDAGYATLHTQETQTVAPELAQSLLGVYPTAGRAKRAVEDVCRQFGLCPRLMGLERSRQACFWQQLGKCQGACTGREPLAVYNQRFQAAFAGARVAAWPYAGPVLITEQSADGQLRQGFVVDQWCLVGRLVQEDAAPPVFRAEAHQFDQDRYKIIRRYLLNPEHRRAVRVLRSEELASAQHQ
ncbi:MAG TPA: exonuclease domain-containing protein [Candidatus Saccharimonadia bacterium]